MKCGGGIFVIVFLMGLMTAVLFYGDVPDGLTEPTKYRSFRATMRLIKLLVSVAHIAHRDEHFDIFYIKSTRYIQDYFSPTPPSEVPGSNIRSWVTNFDGVNVRIYEPIRKRHDAALPAFIFLHGGGMCIGSADSYDDITRSIAERLDCVVVSVNYRLAPEHPFPAGYEDCLRATSYFMEHAHDFDVDQRRIGIGGDSSGGHLSASVAQAIHDDLNLPALKLQVLVYPSIQEIDLNTPSFQKYRAQFGEAGFHTLPSVGTYVGVKILGKIDPYIDKQINLNNHTSSVFKKTSTEYSYVDHNQIPVRFRDPMYYTTRNNVDIGNDAVWTRLSAVLLDPRSAPLMRRDMTRLPPAYIITCGFDALRDDGIFYKNRLEDAGVRVEWVHYEEAFHGIMSLQKSKGFNFKLGITMLDELIVFMKYNI